MQQAFLTMKKLARLNHSSYTSTYTRISFEVIFLLQIAF